MEPEIKYLFKNYYWEYQIIQQKIVTQAFPLELNNISPGQHCIFKEEPFDSTVYLREATPSF